MKIKATSPGIGATGQSFVKSKEFIWYIAAVFFYTNMTGMVGNYRSNYLVNVLSLDSDTVANYNLILSILGYVLSFVYAVIIDNKKIGKGGKFKSLGIYSAIPCGICTVLMFVTPSGLTGTVLLGYLVAVAVIQGASTAFGNSVNMVAVVMSPDSKERDKLLSFRGISSAIGNSAPLVVVLVLGALIKNDDQLLYVVSAGLCGAVGTVTMLVAMKLVKERIAYTEEKKNPLVGFVDVIGNKYALIILVSEFLKNFRSIASYMGIFLAAALLGSPSKYLFFGLPTGIGTFVGMIIIKALLKFFNSKQLYIASGVYSLLANGLAFYVGYLYFNKPDSVFLMIFFLVTLFLIGLQFGASNLLPSMFQADVLEDLELKTGKRLDASLPFVIGIGSAISGAIARYFAPIVLYGDRSIIGYVQAVEGVYPEQEYDTKLKLLFFYTIVHGVMMLLAGLPFFVYKLTGKTRDDIHNAVIEKREQINQTSDVTTSEG